MQVVLLILALIFAGTARAQDPRIAPVLPYGIGLHGSGNIVPKLGTAGELPRVGNTNFKIQLTDGLGGVRCLIAVSLVDMRFYWQGFIGDFAAPSQIAHSHTAGLQITVIQ